MSAFDDLLVPGGQRAWPVVRPEAVLGALVEVERAWVTAQARLDLAPRGAAMLALGALGGPEDYDLPALAAAAEGGGNPVIALVRAARARAEEEASGLIHRGLTSQDVLDTALMLILHRAATGVRADLARAGDALAVTVLAHRETPLMARTLGQYARPTTFGARAGNWLQGLADAAAELDRVLPRMPVGVGGAVGNAADVLPWAGTSLRGLLAAHAQELGLAVPDAVWQARRGPVLEASGALSGAATACARIAHDVTISARSEIGELAEPGAPGRGGSSAMAHKRNPVLSILIRRSGQAAAAAQGQLLQAVALGAEERPAVAWHLEWQPLRETARHGLVAASLTAELLAGLETDAEAMASRVPRSERTDLARATGLASAQADAAVRRWREPASSSTPGAEAPAPDPSKGHRIP